MFEKWETKRHLTPASDPAQVVPRAAEPGEAEAGRGADREGRRIQRTSGCSAEQHADTDTSGR